MSGLLVWSWRVVVLCARMRCIRCLVSYCRDNLDWFGLLLAVQNKSEGLGSRHQVLTCLGSDVSFTI